jgi:enediyne biosynthesis protein E4
VDDELNEFWVGDPWAIFEKHNLSCYERDRLYLNGGGRRFLDFSFVSGADHDGDSRASVAADLNHDGMLDLIVRQAGGQPILVYENQLPPRRWLQVTLRGTQSNRLGIGARLVATVGERQIVRECSAINSYLSQSPATVHFGLQEATQIDTLTIHWPSGLEQKLETIPADRQIVITEGANGWLPARPGVVTPPAK